MAKDKLVIDDGCDRGLYRIVWYLADESDLGAVLGDGPRYTRASLAKTAATDRPHVLATLTAEETGPKKDDRGFYWESIGDARKALRFINVTLKADQGVPWPEWAKLAVANGWKAPKGWKPT